VNCKEHYDLALEGLKLLSRWTATVMEVYSWKLVNPCDTEAQGNKSCPKDAEDYERATRYNYNSKEKFALVEIIGMIKGLQVLMSRLEQLFRPSICWHVYQSIQNFVQKDMREPLRAAAKKKRMKLKIIITSIMSTCAGVFSVAFSFCRLEKLRL
jgi:cytoplasmic FMR1 interacting protein